MTLTDQALERAKLMVDTKAFDFRLIHRNTFGPEPRWAAAFVRNPGDEPEYRLGRSLEDAINRAADDYDKQFA